MVITSSRGWGRTRDDAAGEAFDKAARLLGLGYPGGPAIERAATSGNASAFSLPRPQVGTGYDFSFSGLKTALRRLVASLSPERVPVADLAASFQAAVIDVLVTQTVRAARDYDARAILLAGGVAANRALRQQLAETAPVPVHWPPVRWCTDNAAMIAAAGYFAWQQGQPADWTLDVDATARLGTDPRGGA
ncbi:MAG: hypothetical protein KatS3mg061_1636 [Dehalococcoidia bacterium]|nr:MAG: hypothetical protein KatS3mg061_1636 [Dehalococcoidia bacterium]